MKVQSARRVLGTWALVGMAMLAGCGGDGLNEDPPVPANASASVRATLGLDLSSLLTDVAGRTRTRLTISNGGPGVATNVVAAYQVTGGTVISAISCTSASGGAACPSSPSSLTVPSLPAGGLVVYTIELNYAPNAAGPFNVAAAVTAVNDPVATDNSATLAVPTTFVVLSSERTEYIGQGRDYFYARSDTTLGVTTIGNELELKIDGAQRWTANFIEPGTATTLQTGSFTGLTRYPFQAAGAGGLNFGGEGRNCNTLSGSFSVDEVTYTAGALTSVDLRFVQNCESLGPLLRGRLRWLAP